VKITSRQAWGAILAGSVFVLSVFRAAHQSIVYDEAHAYFWFLDGPLENLLRFNVNNHFLYTYLAKVSIALFGLSELSLRLPSLIGAAIYLFVTLYITDRLFKSTSAFLIVLGLLTLNPLLLDFLCLGRGYCLALGFYMSGLALLILHASWIVASLCFALSIWSSLAFGLVCTATVLVFVLVAAIRRELPPTRQLMQLLLPGPAFLIAVLSPYFHQVKLNQFGAAFDQASLALVDLVNASFFRSQTSSRNLLTLLLPQTPSEMRGTPWVYEYAPSALLAVFMAALLLIAFSVLRTIRRRGINPSQRAFSLIGGSLVLVVLMQSIAHACTGIKYPVDRMALFAVPLVTLAAALFPLSMPRLRLSLAVAVLLSYVLQLDWTGTRTWRYAAGTKAALVALETEVGAARSASLPTVKLGGTWLHQPCVSFYRRSKSYTWLAEFPNSATLNPSLFDYFYFHPDEFPALGPESIERVIYRDPGSGMVMAKMRANPGMMNRRDE
jgi:hypothetical protein